MTREIARFAASPPAAWVWVLPLAGLPGGAMPLFHAMLGNEERARASTFLFAKDAIAYAAAHALLRWSLSARYGHAPREWLFVADALGKPSLLERAAGRGVRMSLSHTDGLVAIALAEIADIGVDAEATMPGRDLAEIARECFTDDERKQLAHAASGFASDVERFYALWTLKEALLKAKGLGLNQAPNSFSVDLRSMDVAVPAALLPTYQWHLQCHKPTGEHIVSLALDGPAGMSKADFSVIEDTGSWLAHCEALQQKAH